MNNRSTSDPIFALSYMRSDSNGVDDEDFGQELPGYGTTPPFTSRMLKKEKASNRKKAKRQSDPMVESLRPASTIAAGGGSLEESPYRRSVSSEAKAILRKRNRDDKLAERQRYAISDFNDVTATLKVAPEESESSPNMIVTSPEKPEETRSLDVFPFPPGVLAERHDFCKTYGMLVKLGTNKRREKEAIARPSPPFTLRHFSQPLLGANKYMESFYATELWIELQAYIDCRSYEEQRQFLSQARFQVGTVLDDIMSFSMKSLREKADAMKAISHMASATSSLPANFQTTTSDPDDSFVILPNPSHPIGIGEPVESPQCLSTEPIDMPAVRIVPPEPASLFDSLSSTNSTNVRSIDPILPEASCITAEQLEALEAVKTLMTRLENSQSYYSTLAGLANDYPLYNSDAFQRRLRALNLWYNVMADLHQNIELLTTWLSVNVAVRPYGIRVRSLRSQALRRLSLQTVGRPRSNTGRRVDRLRSDNWECRDEALAESLPPELLLRRASLQERLREDPEAQENEEIVASLFLSSGGGGIQSERTSTSRYRRFVDKALKQMSLGKLMIKLRRLLHPTLKKAHNALTLTEKVRMVSFDDELQHEDMLLATSPVSPPARGYGRHAPTPPPSTSSSSSRRRRYNKKEPVALCYEFTKMMLPSFRLPFIRLLAVQVDVIHECMRLRLDHKPHREPSALSIKQLIVEYKESIKAAVEAKKYFRKMLTGVLHLDGILADIVDSEREDFEDDLKETLQVYFEYFVSYVNMLQVTGEASRGLKHVLEEEWQFIKELAPHIRGAEAEAGRRFCVMASSLLETTGDYLQCGIDHCFSSVQEGHYPEEQKRHEFIDVCRYIKNLFHEARERASKALGFAKMLRKDLEIAADFTYSIPTEHFLEDLKASDHIQVKVLHEGDYMMFVPQSLKDNTSQIVQLLNVTCGREESTGMDAQMRDGYLLLLPIHAEKTSPLSSLVPCEEDTIDSTGLEWTGPYIEVNIDIETTIGLTAVQVGQLKLIVGNSSLLVHERKKFCHAMGKTVSLLRDQTSSHEDVADRLNELKGTAVRLGLEVLRAVTRVDNFVCDELIAGLDEIAKITVHGQYVETILGCFNFGFEYMKEVSRLLNSEDFQEFGQFLVDFAIKWMDFVLGKCEKGHGKRPRWATQGLEFLVLACEVNLCRLSEDKYQVLKGKMNECITHVIGEAGDSPSSTTPRWRTNSPSLASVERKYRPIKPSPLHVSATRRSASVPSIVYPALLSDDMRSPFSANSIPERQDMTPPLSSDSSASSGIQNESPPRSSTIFHPPLLRTGSSSETHTHVRPLDLTSLRRIDSNELSPGSQTPSASTVTTPGLLESSGKAGTERRGRRMEMIQQELEKLDGDRMAKLRRKRMIGCVSDRKMDVTRDSVGLRVRHVNFPWQRGRKIGEGRYGKVYACVNMETGELIAVKEIHFQGSSHSTIKEIEDEIMILEELHHPNLVRYYGVEVHKEEMYIFMEYCGEGTIWNVAKQGLPEPMIRSYTKQILIAINVLHEHGIVHRDVKGVNIFLSSDGLIKLGDFGCSVKLQNLTTTRPGEISTTRGTVAYMAPEVITSDPSVGSGRAADIWSLGCVVVEMTTGKRPWPEFDHEYSIMFQVGSGKSPGLPDRLSHEGKNFLRHCFEHNPRSRWTASKLLDHPFVKVGTPELELTV